MNTIRPIRQTYSSSQLVLLAFLLSLFLPPGSYLCLGDESDSASMTILVSPEIEPCPVVVTVKPSRQTLQGARSLADYLSRISGRKFSVLQQEQPPSGRAILISELSGDFATDLPGDSYAYRTENGRLLISGPTESGVLNGIYAFLAEQLGCRWWSHNEEDIPAKAEIILPRLDIRRTPPFLNMDLMNHEASRNVNHFPYKLRTATSLQFHGGHTLYPLLTPAATENNEFWPYNKKTGKRAPNKLHMCYSAPGIAEALAEALEKEITKRKGNLKNYIYMVGMGDWYGGLCECERCEAIHLEEGYTRSDGTRRGVGQGANLRMINRAAEILEQKYPGVKVGTFAYMTIERPPEITRPRDNVFIWLPHLRHCIIHGVDKCEKNKTFQANLKKWSEIAPGRVMIWDYAVNYGENFLYPFPVIHSMADNIKLYHKLGVTGIRLQGNYVSTGSDLAVLKNWVWARLLWNPELDTNELIREFCAGYYGPAAEPLLAYVMELENAVLGTAESGPHMNEFAKLGNMRKIYLDKERTALLKRHLRLAAELAGQDEPWSRRVAEAAVSLEAVELCRNPVDFVEIDGRLVRSDMNGEYTFDRALAMTANSREASFREWNSFRNYHSSFLLSHGGPLISLNNAGTQVLIAPAQNLRYWQISYNGKELLQPPRMVKDGRRQVLQGGGYDRVSPSWASGQPVGETTATRLEIEAETRAGNALRQAGNKTIEILENNTVRTTIASHQRSSSKDNDTASNTLYMDYLAGADFNLQGITVMDTTGNWQELAFTAASEPGQPLSATVPEGIKALRIKLPQQNCMVEEHYISPNVLESKVEYSAATGILSTQIRTEPVKIADARRNSSVPKTVIFTWEMRLRPLNQ